MTTARWMALALAGLATGIAHGADWKLDCPAQLATTQAITGTLPDGWSALARTAATVQDAAPGGTVGDATPPISISVFDGPPAEMADLVPDNPNARNQKWTLGTKRPRDIYVVCNYADTRMKLARKVPANVATCTARSGDGVGVTCR